MDSFYFHDELECRNCGYRFFISGDRAIQFPTFCPECGEIEVYRTWNAEPDTVVEKTAHRKPHGVRGSMLSLE